ncbi:MAG: peptide chain release factor N(5)-glutamine methyltransferase, partial [Candidatus Dormibacteria bacterium]
IQFERPLSEAELERTRAMLRRRSRGEPVAYVLGRREFFGLSFAVRPGVLIPRPESEMLVDLAIADSTPARVADLGCGSGCLGIAVAARVLSARVDLVDVSPAAVEVAVENVATLGLDGRVEAFCGSWAQPLLHRGPYDVVLANPPYVTRRELGELAATVRDHEPALALDGGEDGLAAYRDLLPQLPALLAPKARVLLEGDPRRMDALELLCLATLPGVEARRHLDLSERERVLELRLP